MARRYNAAAVLRDGRVVATYRKQCLPNYTVFDEERYFTPGNAALRRRRRRRRLRARHLRGHLVSRARGGRRAPPGAQLVIVPNGSPYHTQQQAARAREVSARARETGLAGRLRQSRRRPGRARVRRRVVRGGRRGRDRPAASGVARDGRHRRISRRRREAGARHARSAARGARLRRARHGRARLRRQEPAFPASCSDCPAASIRR